MRMFYGSDWHDATQKIEVRNPYDDSVVGTVPSATPSDIEAALQGVTAGAKTMAALPGYKRYQILLKASQLMEARADDLGRTISSEEGKTLAEGRMEVLRAKETLELSAEEAKRIEGEVLPLDGASGGAGKLGFTLRIPCGVVAAITPFNFPLNLVVHKVGPALAAGNSVIIKPAGDTPLSALRMVEVLLEAGLPPDGIACLTGSGKTVGEPLVRDARVRKVTFTGSRDVGEHLCNIAGIKRVTMELGSNSPLVVLPDADLEKVANAIVTSGYGNAGQLCISTQRVLALGSAYGDLLDLLRPKVSALRFGNQLDPQTQMGPMVREADAVRVEQWINEAVAGGARVVCGGKRNKTVVEPTVLADVRPEMKISCDELFGPAVGVTRVATVDEAIALANSTRYGLSAAIFTQNIDSALKFARQVESGNIHINWGTAWRADLMPYGGLKDSGLGKEGPKYAIEEMTETKTVIIHG
ncbi:MAG: aldehyde dehydrogenase family protein [Planctomycetia bacterium]|nr:aldehyde dehydrogenase family protein [Planctomycetia bacterium]